MVLVQFDFDENRYSTIFTQQRGYGMPRYRGAPMTGGSFWGRVIGFAKGLFSKAAPHISKAVAYAQPHVKTAANKAIESAVDSAVNHVTEKLKQVQEGKGIKGRRIARVKTNTRKHNFI